MSKSAPAPAINQADGDDAARELRSAHGWRIHHPQRSHEACARLREDELVRNDHDWQPLVGERNIDAAMATDALDPDLAGWWRITETSQWVNDYLDDLGPALISITGHGDRLRMQCLLACVNVRPTKTGASFTWEGAWEYDQMSGTGSVKLGKDGRLHGRFKIKNGDESTFVAEKTTVPAEPIPSPPSYRDKWRRR